MIPGKFSEIQRAVFDIILVEFEDLVHSSEKRVIILNMRIESVSVSQALHHSNRVLHPPVYGLSSASIHPSSLLALPHPLIPPRDEMESKSGVEVEWENKVEGREKEAKEKKYTISTPATLPCILTSTKNIVGRYRNGVEREGVSEGGGGGRDSLVFKSLQAESYDDSKLGIHDADSRPGIYDNTKRRSYDNQENKVTRGDFIHIEQFCGLGRVRTGRSRSSVLPKLYSASLTPTVVAPRICGIWSRTPSPAQRGGFGCWIDTAWLDLLRRWQDKGRSWGCSGSRLDYRLR
ncbi:hypothetical protein BJ165DRAFT_1613498 [Panaeolus papilionaceus]|nr:hypothetical protein BJ165DRAFT_1613498 [Panaeolus papilionaceus]